MSTSTVSNTSKTSKDPVVFDEFFEMGLHETVSPFLTPDSRAWGAHLTLKASLLAACLLVIAFALSFSMSTVPLSNLLLIAVYFFAGIPSLIESIEDLIDFDINIDVLMTLAAFSSVLIGSGMEGALLLVLFALSGSMEDAVTSRAKSAISSLHKLSPTRACVVENDGLLVERAVNEVAVGAHILIKSGQIVPLDGVVIEGTSSVNLGHLTGENFPVTKKVGDRVAAGARNLEGAFTLRVTHTSADSTLARIIQLVTQAQEARPALQRWFDKLSRKYAISIILLAIGFALFLPFIISIPFLGLEGSIYRALAFLIAASPCALIIAIPIAYLSAVSACARKGILLKGGVVLDALATCSSIAFDKTGTLTTGELTCDGVENLNQGPQKNLIQALSAAYALEKNAVHPIAKSILAYGPAQQAPLVKLKDFKTVPGYGLEAIVQFSDGDQTAYMGNPDHIISRLPIDLTQDFLSKAREIQERGELLAVLLLGEEIFLFRFRDTLRTKIRKTIALLKQKYRLKLVMLTGDHENSAKRIADNLGIDVYYANLKPEDKMQHVVNLSKQSGLAMVGDGINDAPALARATVGICMGKIGSTAAIDAADVVLLNDNVESLGWLIGKAKKTSIIVKQNLILAASAIVIASLPALSGIIPLWLAVVLHEGGTVLVGLNGLRLLKK